MSSGTISNTIEEPERFRASAFQSVGVEVELPILDIDTGDLVPGSPRLLAACADEGVENVGAELMQSMLEVRTGICDDVGAVRSQLVDTLQRVRNIGTSLGYDLALWATHPFARPTAHVLFPDDRYRAAHDRLAWMTYHRVTFGLHVHVGVSSGDEAIGLINVLVQYLPHMLAFSSNSPFWHGIDTGLESTRASLYGLVPHAGVPPWFESFQECRNYLHVMQDCRVLRSFKDIKWDIRPRPDLGTIEFRICDTPASLSEVCFIAALARNLVRHARTMLQERPEAGHGDVRRHWITVENKWLACRFGLEAVYIRPPAGKRRLLRQELESLIERLIPIAEESGDAKYLKKYASLENHETGAQRQRRLYRDAGEWKALVADATARLRDELRPASKQQQPTTPTQGSPGDSNLKKELRHV